MDTKKASNIFKIIMLVVLTAFITFIITVALVYQYIQKDNYKIAAKNLTQGENTSQTSTLEATLANFRQILENKYIGEIDDKKLIEGAIKGYVEGLEDPYTEYLTIEEMSALQEETTGEYVGIGVYISNNTVTNEIVVVRTIGNSPAFNAGILVGDIIKSVDGIEYKGEQLNDVSTILKGEPGTTAKIIIIRNSEEIEMNITRENIKLVCVNSKKLNNNVGYLKITSFDGGCANEFYERYKELENQGIKSLIIDLRFNGGGLVNEALSIGELFTEKDATLLITKSKNSDETITKAQKDREIDLPVVVLVNEYSASASEILTGILKENGVATIVGKLTYGKGVIQTVYQLTDGSGLKITTDEYFTPNHNEINKIGITPDIEVTLPEELQYTSDILEKDDTQLQKAIETLK